MLAVSKHVVISRDSAVLGGGRGGRHDEKFGSSPSAAETSSPKTCKFRCKMMQFEAVSATGALKIQRTPVYHIFIYLFIYFAQVQHNEKHTLHIQKY